MTSVKEQIADTEMSVLTIKSIDLIFFEFLLNKHDIDINYRYNALEEKLHWKAHSDNLAKDVIQLTTSLDSACKEIYQLQEQEIKTADDFVYNWEKANENGNVFVIRLKNQYSIMAQKDYRHKYIECKRKFEVKVLKLSYYTFEKIEVRILNDKLENLDEVDAIVNPVDETFEQKGQISRTLSLKGGKTYDKECEKLKRKSEKEKCSITGWGDNKRTRILHTVCPSIDKVKPEDVQTIVYETVYNCLKTAENEAFETVTIPFLYTGHGNVPVDKCALPFAQAILQFSMERENDFCVNRIDFIDQDQEKTEILFSYFDEILPKTVSQYFEIPSRENAKVLEAVPQNSEGMSECQKSCEENDCNASNELSVNERPVDKSVYDSEYETIDMRLNRKTSDETVQDLTATRNTLDENVEREKDDGYENIKFADETDDDNVSDKGVESSLESQVVNLGKNNSNDTFNENNEMQCNKISEVLSDDNNCKDHIETLRSGLKIICVKDVQDGMKKQNNTRSEGYHSTTEVPKIENKTCINISAKDTDQSTKSSRSVFTDNTKHSEENSNYHKYEALYCIRNSHPYENNECVKDTVNGSSRKEKKKVGNILIIDETNTDLACTIQESVMQQTNADKTISVNVQQQEQLGEDIDACDHGSVDAINESEHVSQDTETYNIDMVLEKQINSSEEKIDTHEKEIQLKDPSLGVSLHGRENVQENKEEIEPNLCDKPYCSIRVENRGSVHEYYNIETVTESKASPMNGSKLTRQSHSETDSNCPSIENDFKAKIAGGHTVWIYKGDIRKADTGVIICPEIPNTRYGGIIAVAIKCTYRNVASVEVPRKLIKSKGKRIATTDCRLKVGAYLEEEQRASFIYHVQTPIYKTTDDKESLIQCIGLIFKKLKNHRKRKVKRIYIPLLGIEDVSNEDNVKACCRILVEAIHKKCTEHKSLRDQMEVVLVNRCKRITDMLIKEMKILTEPSD